MRKDWIGTIFHFFIDTRHYNSGMDLFAQKIFMKKTLYQLNSNGKPKVWTIEVVKVSETLSNIVIHHGLQDGKMVEDVTPITEGKSTGRINATTVYEQAVRDAETEFNKKVKKGYVEDITQIKAKGETHSIKEPMKGFQIGRAHV